jgi:glutaredoxin-like YruB-family protein
MTVQIYTTPACKWCKMLKEYLDANNVSYQNFDVSRDKYSALEMIKKSGQSAVPVIDIDNNIIVGFEKEQLDKLLNKQIVCRF